jgi:hypothetical protein
VSRKPVLQRNPFLLGGVAFLVTLALLAVVLASCGSATNTSVNQEQAVVNAQQDQYNKVQPIPFYDYSLQRQALIDIYNSQNQNSQTWDVITSYSGQFLFQCEAVGWPIPAAAQLSNPQQVVHSSAISGNYGYGTVGQAEPNGIYTGNTQGTYILCARPDGKIAPVYTENNVQMFPFPVKVDPATGAITDAGGSSSIVITVKPGNVTAAPSPSP